MEWWTDLWLNEGFATYTQYIGSNHVYPDSAILGKYCICFAAKHVKSFQNLKTDFHIMMTENQIISIQTQKTSYQFFISTLMP